MVRSLFIFRKISENLIFFIWNGSRFLRRKLKSNHAFFKIGDLCATKVRGDYIHRRNRSVKFLLRRSSTSRLKKEQQLKKQLLKSKLQKTSSKSVKKKK